jgi:hypothetical protein
MKKFLAGFVSALWLTLGLWLLPPDFGKREPHPSNSYAALYHGVENLEPAGRERTFYIPMGGHEVECTYLK